MTLSIKEMLKLPYFSNASILAGKNGLNRQVHWTHVIEIEQFGHLLNGNEVVLTTGISWAGSEEKGLAFLQQLIDHNAAALCIELVVHVKRLPKKMLALAEKHHFPIISFQEEVRFIDIMMELHEQILGSQGKVWVEIEEFHQKLRQSLTSDGTIGDFLRLLHQHTNKNVALNYEGEYRFFPSPSESQQMFWIEKIEQQTNFYSQPLYLLNEQVGTLLFLDPLKNISNFDELALKRTSEFVSQYFWLHHQQQEVKQMERNKWIMDVIHRPTTHEEIARMIQHYKPDCKFFEAIIAVKPEKKSLMQKDKEKLSETRFIMSLRSALTQNELELFTVKDTQNELFILLILNQKRSPLITSLQKALHLVSQNNTMNNRLKWLSFGKVFNNYTDINRSYHAAVSTLTYQQRHGVLTVPFYSNLTVYRLIDQMKDKRELTDIIEDYLAPLLEHDNNKGTELVKTLKVYLENLGQKNETAQALHIVRQTLYHRLNKIEQLLGEDYMKSEKRFMIEFAIHAIQFNE